METDNFLPQKPILQSGRDINMQTRIGKYDKIPNKTLMTDFIHEVYSMVVYKIALCDGQRQFE